MRRLLITLLLCCPVLPAHAWNAAGHRIVAVIAWQQLQPDTKAYVSAALARHPDFERWREKARSADPQLVFAEAATWPDSIRDDPRYFDERRERPTPPIPGLPDNARHLDWHYVNVDSGKRRAGGELDHQIESLSQVLRSTVRGDEISFALPWLIHLVADIHQPLHVGNVDDRGGNRVEIENPFDRRHPMTNLHKYWDDLPGPSNLRGRPLLQRAWRWRVEQEAPAQGNVSLWREESRKLLEDAYPVANGNSLPLVDAEFLRRTQDIARQRLVAAGYRLGSLLESDLRRRVSRETIAPSSQGK